MTSVPSTRYYRFGTCMVDVRRRRVWRNRQVVPLTAKTFDVLVFLVRRPNRAIDKAEFFAVLWPDTSVLEANLVRHVSLLRKALGQRPDSHEYIVTIPGRGYEFVADVEELGALPPDWVDDEAAVTTGSQDGVEGPTSTVIPPAPLPAPTPLVTKWRRPLVAAAAVAVLGVGWTAWSVARRDGGDAVPQRMLHQVTFESGSPREPSWSPDSQQLVFTSDASGNADLWVQSVGDPQPRQLTTDPAEDSAPSWSPDGKWIVFRSERDGGGIFRVSSDGREEQRVSSFGFHPQWAPSGDLILFSGPTVRTGPRRFFVVAAEGGAPREVAVDVVSRLTASGPSGLAWLSSVAASWYPDGTRISFWGRAPSGRWEFVTSSLASGTPVVSAIPADVQTMLQREVSLRRFVWAPTRRHLYFEGETGNVTNIWRVAVNPITFAWLSAPERLTTSAGEEVDLAIAPDGRQIAVSIATPRTRLWSIEFDAQTGRVIGAGDAITSGNAGEIDADPTRDGTKIAYRATRAGRNEVWELDTTNGQERLLLASVGWRPSTPRWSSDGRYIAYNRRASIETADQESNVVAVLSAAEGQERLLALPSGAFMTPTDWSADGGTILGSCRTEARSLASVCSMSANAERPAASALRVIASQPGMNLWVPRFSPNQRWIAFLGADAVDAPTSRVFVAGKDGGGWTPITDGQSFDDKPRWSPDGRTIYFISSREGGLNVWGRRFDPDAGLPVGESFRVTSFSGQDRILPSDISRIEFGVTGDRLFLPMTERAGNLWVLDHADR